MSERKEVRGWKISDQSDNYVMLVRPQDQAKTLACRDFEDLYAGGLRVCSISSGAGFVILMCEKISNEPPVAMC